MTDYYNDTRRSYGKARHVTMFFSLGDFAEKERVSEKKRDNGRINREKCRPAPSSLVTFYTITADIIL